MKKTLIALAAAIGVLIVAVIVVPFLIPTATWKSQIEERVSAATGRKLTIAGPVHLSLLPAVAFVANDVTLANAPGARDATMATIGKLEVRVRLLPLLSGTLAIDRFVVEKPVIHLEVNRQGQPNWDFGGTARSAATAQPSARSTESPPGGSGSGAASVALGDVRMSDGTVTYWDARGGASYDVSDIDARLSFPDLDHPFKFDGSLVWNGQKIALTAEVANPHALSGGGRSAVGLGFRSAPLAGVIKGTASGVSPVKFDGTLSVSSPSVRNLIAWAGKKPPTPGNALGPLSISGKLAADGAKIAFTDATYKLDALQAKGDLSVDNTGHVPYVKATLATNVLDLNPYLASAAKATPGPGKAAPKAPASAAQGWSTEPIDVSALKAANADLALTADGLIVRDIKLGKSALGISLKDGKLTVDLKELALYQGAGTGRLTIDGSGRVPIAALDLHLKNVQAEPLLKDTMGLDAVRGTAIADVTLNATGASQRDLISALDGKGAIRLRNGAIRGFDLGAMLRNIGDAFSSAKGGGGDETTFADASATFTIARGLARNDDLILQAPFFRATGKGTANLPERTVNYRVEPKVVASGSGQSGSKDALGVAVPVVIKGRWDKLSYEPDLAGMLSVDPKGTVKGILNMFKGGSKSGNGGQPSDGQQKPANPLDQLKSLFGR